jgi:phosphatidylcholine synthase
MSVRTALAWCAHLYTALGLVLAAWIAILIVRGSDGSFRLAFVLMLAATVIDATDGWLARKTDVRKHTPGFDGRRLDDLIDFHTYTTLPLLLLWRADIPSGTLQWVLLLPLLASAYGFSQADAKTPDGYFLGFPSYWNIVAFYLYCFRWPAGVAAAVLALFGALTFVPSRYLYPTQPHRYSVVTNALGALWGVQLIVLLVMWRDAPPFLLASSFSFPAYYLALSWIVSIRAWRRERPARHVVV